MNARIVLDSYSVIAYLENEPGAVIVRDLIKQARHRETPLLLSVINWGEIYYITCRTAGRQAAEKALQIVDTLPIEIVDVDQSLTLAAAEFKASKKMSYADCFAAALAKQFKAELVTGDPEFKEVQTMVRIRWLKA